MIERGKAERRGVGAASAEAVGVVVVAAAAAEFVLFFFFSVSAVSFFLLVYFFFFSFVFSFDAFVPFGVCFFQSWRSRVCVCFPIQP